MTGLDLGAVSYVHGIAGRLRVRVSNAKGNAEIGDALTRMLSRTPGVQSVRSCTITGSVVIQYDCARIDEKRLLSALQIARPSTTISKSVVCTCGAAAATRPAPITAKVGSWLLGKIAELVLEHSLTLLVGALL